MYLVAYYPKTIKHLSYYTIIIIYVPHHTLLLIHKVMTEHLCLIMIISPSVWADQRSRQGDIIPYKNKYWWGTKFGKLANHHTITKFKSHQYFFYSISIVILVAFEWFRQINILPNPLFQQIAKYYICQYLFLYSICLFIKLQQKFIINILNDMHTYKL